ncbi:hypothetical protein AHAS_Ahas03G0333400 [Arachis hypogaea]
MGGGAKGPKEVMTPTKPPDLGEDEPFTDTEDIELSGQKVDMEPSPSRPKAENIIKKLGFESWCISETNGFVGGIWCLWKKSHWEIEPMHIHNQFIHMKDLSQHLGINLTCNLGKHLGVPLIHEKCNKQHFQFIIDKMKAKLSSWNIKMLSFAERCTLIQLVLASIPNYVMQTMKISKEVCNQIDNICRDFLWEETEANKKIHLIK